MERKKTIAELRKTVRAYQKIRPFDCLMYFFLAFIAVGIAIRIMIHHSINIMPALLITLGGLVCFLLFYKAIGFFKNS
ncbi:hypothetical protein [Parapedobacter koreensis]|uniref:Uncharacterized protein n=1 Tax=Parapedobacter koreensis TaxID=332977 RepID=A0A1H7MGB9_9SPHI|nr:hypothetical protein [Parapedobacter koreensis]SEL10119.1 hypothetical protein SAMN05421740_103500 [Parapedobacter koreensis]